MGEGIGTEDGSTRASCCSVIRSIGKPRDRYDNSYLQSEQVVVPYEGTQRRHGQGMDVVDVGATAVGAVHAPHRPVGDPSEVPHMAPLISRVERAGTWARSAGEGAVAQVDRDGEGCGAANDPERHGRVRAVPIDARALCGGGADVGESVITLDGVHEALGKALRVTLDDVGRHDFSRG